MKYAPFYAIALLLIAVFWMAGCAPKPPPLGGEPAPENAGIRVPQDESFDPLSLQEEDVIKLPESKLKPSSTTKKHEGAEKRTNQGGEVEEVLGYRVQIFTSDSEFDARAVEDQALLRFDESVYLIFDSPNYKVRVGDCSSRAEANELRKKAVKLGYNDAWVVQSKVVVNGRR